jgi:hypothetical protein
MRSPRATIGWLIWSGGPLGIGCGRGRRWWATGADTGCRRLDMLVDREERMESAVDGRRIGEAVERVGVEHDDVAARADGVLAADGLGLEWFLHRVALGRGGDVSGDDLRGACLIMRLGGESVSQRRKPDLWRVRNARDKSRAYLEARACARATARTSAKADAGLSAAHRMRPRCFGRDDKFCGRVGGNKCGFVVEWFGLVWWCGRHGRFFRRAQGRFPP